MSCIPLVSQDSIVGIVRSDDCQRLGRRDAKGNQCRPTEEFTAQGLQHSSAVASTRKGRFAATFQRDLETAQLAQRNCSPVPKLTCSDMVANSCRD